MWASLAAAAIGLLSKLAGSIPLLAAWLAERAGERAANTANAAAQNKADADAEHDYAVIDAKPAASDDEIGKELRDGTF